MKVLVTGATGFIGSHLAQALVERGHEVACLIRKSSNLKWLENLSIKRLPGDLLDTASIIPLVKEVDFIYHLAGATKSPSTEGYYQANYVATKNLIEAVKAFNPGLKRFVHISSLAAVGPSQNGGLKTEDSPCYPITDYGKSKLQGELEVRKYFGSIPITIIRPPVVYGPRDRDLYLYFRTISRGIKPLLGAGKRLSIIHVGDLVAGMIQAAETSVAAGKIYFMSNDKSCTMEYLSDLVKASIKGNVITLRIPDAVVYFLAVASEYLALIRGKPTIFNRQKALEIAQRAWVCDNSRARQELGFRAWMSIESGIRQAAEWYFQNKWLRN